MTPGWAVVDWVTDNTRPEVVDPSVSDEPVSVEDCIHHGFAHHPGCLELDLLFLVVDGWVV